MNLICICLNSITRVILALIKKNYKIAKIFFFNVIERLKFDLYRTTQERLRFSADQMWTKSQFVFISAHKFSLFYQRMSFENEQGKTVQ